MVSYSKSGGPGIARPDAGTPIALVASAEVREAVALLRHPPKKSVKRPERPSFEARRKLFAAVDALLEAEVAEATTKEPARKAAKKAPVKKPAPSKKKPPKKAARAKAPRRKR
jgi:DNA-binding protein HU-beta